MSTNPFDLARFEQAQDNHVFDQALKELHAGCKTGHWMWFIFPQITGLGHSHIANTYAIKSQSEAQAYLAHSLLGPRLILCTQAVNSLINHTVYQIFHAPDHLKFFSSMTLFAEVSAPESPFNTALEMYFSGKRDLQTLNKLAKLKTRRD
jgi:uncharacterized protein (DUF1810 family)